LQALYYMDMRRNASMEAFRLFSRCFPASETTYPFFEHLTLGVLKNCRQIDSVIVQFSDNWKLSRMSCVDRNIMRIALFEMLFCPDIPAKVSINEAVDIGKKFGTEESGAFINGILDSAHIAIEESRLTANPEAGVEIPEQVHGGEPALEMWFEETPPPQIHSVRGRSDIVKRHSPKKSGDTPSGFTLMENTQEEKS